MYKKIFFLFILMFFAIVVNAQNSPTAANSSVSTNEDVDKVFAAADFNFNDIDGDVFYSIQVTGLESVGELYIDNNLNGLFDGGGEQININDFILVSDFNKLKFKPLSNQNGNSYDNFDFKVADNNDGLCFSSYTMTIDVIAVNDDPVVSTNIGLTVNEASTGNNITTASLETTDIEQSATNLTYTVNTKPANGILRLSGTALNNGDTYTQQDINSGNVTYDHDGSETTTDSYSFTVDDGNGGSVSGVFNITINPVNDAPIIATNGGKTVNEASVNNIILQTNLECTDVDNSAAQLTYTLTVVPTNGQLKLSGITLSAGQTFTQADINSNNVTYTHDGSETLSDLFKFTVSDGSGGNIAETTFNLTITAQNDAPVVSTNNNISLNEAASVTITNAYLVTSDVDNTALQLTYTISSVPSNGTVYRNAIALGIGGTFTQDDIDNNRISYTHNGGETTTDNFTFSVSDGTANTASTTFNITINPVNDAPIIATNGGKTVNEASVNNIILQTDLECTDVDNSAAQLTYTLTVIPTNGQLKLSGTTLSAGQIFTQADINSNNVTYTHDGSETLSDLFKFTVSDGSGGNIAETTFNLTITAQNDAPTITTNNTLNLNEASTATITNAFLETSDVDNTALQLTYTISSVPANGTVYRNAIALGIGGTFTQDDIDNNRISYTHNGSETTTDNFTFSVSDGTANTASTTFNITINPVNDVPVLVTNSGKNVNEGDVNQVIYQTDLESADVDNSAGELLYTLTVIPTNGQLKLSGIVLSVGNTFTQGDINSNLVTYSHDSSETVTDLFKFTVSDGAGGNIAETTFNITVNAVNDIPYFSTFPSTVADEGIVYTYNIAASDNDNTGNQLSFTTITKPAWLNLTDNGDGTAILTGTPPHGVARNNPVTLNVTDGTDNQTQSFTIIVSLDIIVPGDFTTIQNAINASVDGDKISVQPGTYFENIDFIGKDIEIVGNEADPSQIIIDGSSSGPTVSFISGEPVTATINGVTIQNGSGRLGVISSTSYHAPASGYYGGGVFIYASNATLKNIVIKDNNLQFYNNHGGSGAGIYIAAGSSVSIIGDFSTCIIDNNISNVYRGGGICVDDSYLSLNNVDITNNYAGNYGAGIGIYNSTMDMINTTISGNTVDGVNGIGGGIFSLNSLINNNGGNSINSNSATITGNNQYIFP